jgi:serine/threonine-protein kinase
MTDDSPSPPADIRAPDALRNALGDDFEIVRELGRGAVATVYLARDRMLGVLVAIKVLNPSRATDETTRRRFEREARAAASLSEHPNVVAVHRFGRLSDETPYLVMQYVRGRTMEERIKAEGRLSAAEARKVLLEVASALQVAHARGFVHRDVRPGNVLWDEDHKRALLTDFGIAAILASGGEEVTRLTRTGQLLGDPRYLSPEQLEDKDVTEHADIYQLGALGYELLTGEGPYDARSNADWIVAHLSKEPRDLKKMRPDVDPDLADLLRRCLNRTPLHRPSAADVVRLLGGKGAGGAAAGGVDPASPADDMAQLIKRRVPQIVGIAVAASVAIIGLASDLTGDGRLPEYAVDLSLALSGAMVVGSAVVAWFHGERGKQRAPVIEYVLLGLVAVAWLVVSSWIIVSE